MATCVVSLILDTDTDRMRPACQVHCTFVLPCRHSGQPAAPEPMHTDSVPSREAAIRHWQQRTRGQRPLVVHRGSFSDREHRFDDTLPASCWCGVETVAVRCPECRCDVVLCETDDSGEHCADQACGTCLHGCPLDDCPACPVVR